MLRPAQVAHYRRRGYVVVRGLVSGTEIALLRDAVGQLLDAASVGPDQPHDRDGNPVPHPRDYSFLPSAERAPVLNRRFAGRSEYRYRPWIAATGNGAAADPATAPRTPALAL